MRGGAVEEEKVCVGRGGVPNPLAPLLKMWRPLGQKLVNLRIFAILVTLAPWRFFEILFAPPPRKKI